MIQSYDSCCHCGYCTDYSFCIQEMMHNYCIIDSYKKSHSFIFIYDSTVAVVYQSSF